MKVKDMLKELKKMDDNDEIIFWEWNGERSKYYPLAFTVNCRFHKGYISTYVSGYSPEIEPNVEKGKCSK